MAANLIFACVIVLVSWTAVSHLAMGLAIEITPQTYTDKSTGGVIIGCVLDSLDGCDKKAPMVLGLGKEGEELLAFVQQPSTIDYYIDPDKKYHAQGHLDKDTYTGYLNVSLEHPDDTDSGRYTCVIFCRYDIGVSQEVQASKSLSVEKLDLNMAVRGLLDQVALLNSKVLELTAANEDLTRDKAGKDSVADVIGSVDELKNTTSREIADLKGKVTSNTAFSATIKSTVDVPRGQVIVYNNVITNIGNAYDSATGVYTAPMAGLYAFHLALHTRCSGCDSRAQIQVNGVEVATVRAYESESTTQSSSSFVRALVPGDEVKVVPYSTGVQLEAYRKLNLFSGYLVRPF